MTWDVQWWDDDAKVIYRLRVKRLTVGDGMQIDADQDAISKGDYEGRELLMRLDYPLWRLGTTAAERAGCETAPEKDENEQFDLPEDLTWETVEMTESTFWALPEILMLLWKQAILNRNPHRSMVYDHVKKNVLRALLTKENATTTSNEAPSESASETLPSEIS